MNTETVLSMFKTEVQTFEQEMKVWHEEDFKGGLSHVEHAIINHMAKVEKELLNEVILQIGTGYSGTYIACIKCNKMAKYKGLYDKRINTLQQEQILKRAYYYCYRCAMGFCPLDEKLKIKQEEISPGLRQVVTELSSQMPFSPVSEFLWQMRRVVISANTNRRVTQSTGGQVEGWQKGRSIFFNKWSSPGKDKPEAVLYCSADGTSINIRGEGWKQPKVGVVFETEGESIKQRRYVAGFLEKDEFGRRWEGTGKDLADGRKVQWVSIMDGAGYLWELRKDCFPDSEQILDFYHAKERLYTIGKLVYGEGSVEGGRWAQRSSSLLLEGKVLELIERVNCLEPKPKEAKKYVRQSVSYYTNNAHRMHYQEYRQKGYRIGSGVIEGGGCKNVVGDRFKRTGMRWSKQGAHNTLQVRASLLDETLKLFWKDRYELSIP